MQRWLVLSLVVIVLTVGAVHSVAAQPKGDVVYVMSVTIAPSWFDPAESPAQITPYVILYACMTASCAPCLASVWGQRWQNPGVKALMR